MKVTDITNGNIVVYEENKSRLYLKYDFHYSPDGEKWYYVYSSNHIRSFSESIEKINKRRQKWRIVISGNGTIVMHYTGKVFCN